MYSSYMTEAHLLNIHILVYPLLLQKGDLAIYYELAEGEDIQKRGIVEVDPTTGRCILIMYKSVLRECSILHVIIFSLSVYLPTVESKIS